MAYGLESARELASWLGGFVAVTRDDLVDALTAYWGRKTLQLESSRIANAVGAGTVMPSGDSRKILALKHDGAAGQDSLLTAVFTRTAVEIAYESMYEEPFVTRIP